MIAEAAYEVTLKPGTSIALGATFVARMKDVDGLPNRSYNKLIPRQEANNVSNRRT